VFVDWGPLVPESSIRLHVLVHTEGTIVRAVSGRPCCER
jgi:hypothetical protein